MLFRYALLVCISFVAYAFGARPCDTTLSFAEKLECLKKTSRTEEALTLLSERMLTDSSLVVSREYLHMLEIKKDKGGLKRFGPKFVRRFIDSAGGFWDAVRVMALQGVSERALSLMANRCEASGAPEDFMRMARILTESGARSQAESILEKVEQLIGGPTAEIYYLKSRLVYVKSLLEKVLNRQERSVLHEQALPFLEQAVALDSSNVFYQLLYVQCLDSLFKYQEACSSCAQNSRRLPPDAALDGYCGDLFFKLLQSKPAIFHYERAYQQDSFHVDRLLNLERCYKRIGEGNAYYMTGQERLAYALPETLSIRYNLAIEWLARDSLERAHKAFAMVLAKNPDYEEANKGMAATLLRMHRTEESLQYLERHNKLRPVDNKDRFTVAQMLLLRGDTARAIEGFEKVLKETPKHGGAAYTLATFAFNKGEWERLIQVLKYPEYCKDSLGASRMLGTALYKLGRSHAQAYTLLKRALNGDDADEPLCFMVADLAEKLGETGEAIQLFETCLMRYPDSPNGPYYESRIKKLR